MRFHRFAVALLISSVTLPMTARHRVPNNLSSVRGFNYQSAETIGRVEFWLQYNPAITERDLDYARRLQLNEVRVFVPCPVWEKTERDCERTCSILCAPRTTAISASCRPSKTRLENGRDGHRILSQSAAQGQLCASGRIRMRKRGSVLANGWLSYRPESSSTAALQGVTSVRLSSVPPANPSLLSAVKRHV